MPPDFNPSSDPMAELRALYAIEAAEHVGTLNRDLLALEAATLPAERQALLQGLERAAHSLKGASRAVGIASVESVAHPLETVFHAVRNGTLTLNPAVADVLYDVLDTLGALLAGDTPDLPPVIAALEALVVHPEQAPALLQTLSIVPPSPEDRIADRTAERMADASHRTSELPLNVAASAERTTESTATIRVATHRLDDLLTDVGDLLITSASYEQRTVTVQQLRQAHQRWQRDWRRVRTVYLHAVRAATPDWPPLLDFLNQTQHYMRISDQLLTTLEQGLAQDNLHLRRIVTALQDNTRQARLVPFETHVTLLQRAVRDLARDQGKTVTLTISGAALELDRQVLEAITDPLLHLTRNAVDHGLEAPAGRIAAGKPSAGSLNVALAQRGGELTISISDDGAGIDVNAVRQQARRLISPAEIDALADPEALALVMLPGLSTRSQVTAISGRGVGLDVVRRNVEALHGRVEIDSVFGQGTTFRLIVPISMSTIRCMLVRVGADTYALPTTVIEQVIRVRPDESFNAGGRRLIRVGTRTLPLATLAEVLARPGGEAPTYALILAAAERRAVFLFDDALTEQEVVVKPLAASLAALPYIAGATLLGSGEVVIILSASDLIRTAQTAVPGEAPRPLLVMPVNAPPIRRVLVVDDSITTRTLEKNILEAAGYLVTTAVNGLEALELLTTTACDALVSDVEMPRMDGFDLTARVRSLDRLATLPIILVTSLDSEEQRERGLRVGADRYIVKGSFDQSELLQALEQLIGG